jgi:iron(III) transport system permease protein
VRSVRDITGRHPFWAAALLATAGLLALPIAAVVARIAAPTGVAWAHLVETGLGRVVANSLAIAAIVLVNTLVVGAAAAWIIERYEFPLRRLVAWALLLPLALPAYIVGYAWTDLTAYAGPIQSGLRAAFGWGRGDYWFPDLHGPVGAGAMLALVLYPYVYILARVALREQAAGLTDVARTLGADGAAATRRVALPMARPALAAGGALAVMEALADFGTVQHFGIDTFTTTIFRLWYGAGDRAAAAQLSVLLLMFVALVMALEWTTRARARYWRAPRVWRPRARAPVGGVAGIMLALVALLPALLGFVAPVALLARLAIQGGDPALGQRFLQHAWNSVSLAGLAAVATLTVALLFGYGRRMLPARWPGWVTRTVGLGYAIPGTVVAVGVLIALGALDSILAEALSRLARVETGLVFGGSVAALTLAYVVRFLAIADQSVSAGLARVTPAMDHAARVLGAGPARLLARVHLPLLTGSMAAAALMVFVDTVKELPASIVVRPFGFDTLAIRVYTLASDERLTQAASGALAIVAVGLLPVVLLGRLMERGGAVSAPGSSASRP